MEVFLECCANAKYKINVRLTVVTQPKTVYLVAPSVLPSAVDGNVPPYSLTEGGMKWCEIIESRGGW